MANAALTTAATIALPVAASYAAGAIGGEKGQKALGKGMRLLQIPQMMSAATDEIKKTTGAFKHGNANSYHGKLNSFYQDKLASENNDAEHRKERVTELMAKAAPYVVGGSLLLSYGAQAAKNKSLKEPVKKAISGVPVAVLNTAKKKSSVLKGAVKGVKEGLKESNKINVYKEKRTPFESFVNGAASGAGLLGVYMLGEAYFKNKKKDIAKGYKKAQPAPIQVAEAAKDMKQLYDVVKSQNEDNEKVAGDINWSSIAEYGIKQPAATAVPAFFGRQISSGLERLVRDTARKRYITKVVKKSRSKSDDSSDKEHEKKASFRDSSIVKNIKRKANSFRSNPSQYLKNDADKFVKNYGTKIITSIVKPAVATAATLPLIYGSEILKQKKITKNIEKKREQNAERYRKKENNHGRNSEGSERDANSKSNL